VYQATRTLPSIHCPISSRSLLLPISSTVALADEASEMRARGESVIDLSAGRVSEATDREIGAAGSAAIVQGITHSTPARGAPDYLLAVAEKLARENDLIYVPETEIVATLGCKNGLVLALMSILDPGDEVIVEDPCFVSYGPTIELCGGKTVVVPTDPANRWTWTREALERAVTPKTRAILFCSPGNPTGTVHTEANLSVIAEVASQHGLMVIADEIYESVTWGGRRHTPIASLPGMQSRTIGLMGMTKSYAMGGWRIGYAYAPALVAERMTMIQGHLSTCASSISQVAATRALRADISKRFATTLWREWEDRCVTFTGALSKIPWLRVEMPEAGYYAWIDVSQTGLTSTEFANGLLHEEKVVVVPGASFGNASDAYVRATCVKSRDEIATAAVRIRSYVERVAATGQPQESLL
jgi:aspartate/methionine/tyrosine aminotransferase